MNTELPLTQKEEMNLRSLLVSNIHVQRIVAEHMNSGWMLGECEGCQDWTPVDDLAYVQAVSYDEVWQRQVCPLCREEMQREETLKEISTEKQGKEKQP